MLSFALLIFEANLACLLLFTFDFFSAFFTSFSCARLAFTMEIRCEKCNLDLMGYLLIERFSTTNSWYLNYDKHECNVMSIL